MPAWKDPERILLVRLSHLGDVVCALPLYHALRDAFPRAAIAWVVQPEFAGLLEGLSGLERVVPFGRRSGWRAWPRLHAELRRFRPDLVVDAQGNLKSAAAVLCARAPRRAGLHRADWTERLGARVLNDAAPPAPARHLIERMHALARHVVPGAAFPPRADPDLSPAERAAGEARLGELLPDPSPRDVILHVPQPGDVRSWPPERFAELASLLLERGRHVLLLSGPREEAVGRELARTLGERPGLAHWIGQRGLRELAALFSAAARAGLRMACVDSGPMHLACAAGLAPVLIAGPQAPARTGPWVAGGPDGRRIVRAADPPDCAPCLKRTCSHPDGPVCMTRIRAEDVARALDAAD